MILKKSSSIVSMVFLFAAVAAGSGCATIMRGSSETLHVWTSPAGATVTLSTGQQCIAPCGVEVKRRGEVRVAVSKENCVSQEISVSSQIDAVGITSLIGAPVTAFVPWLAILESGIYDDDDDTDEWDNLYNLVWAALVVVDVGTGAVFAHDPNPVRFILDCVDPPVADDKSTTTDPPDS